MAELAPVDGGRRRGCVIVALVLLAVIVLGGAGGIGLALLFPSRPTQITAAKPTQEVQIVQVVATDTPLPSPTPTFNMTPVRTEVIATAPPFRTSTPVVAATKVVTTTLRVDAFAPGSCALDRFVESARFGVQLDVKKLVNTFWEFDPAKAKWVAGDTAHPELAASADLSGCPVIIEGRKVLIEEHHIWVLMPGDGKYLDQDKIFRAKEFSAWAYPTNWNLETFGGKPPIVAEFVTAKRNNQKANGYDWKIVVHGSDGSQAVFPAGQNTPLLDTAVTQGNCKFGTPQKLNVTGVYDAGKNLFNASIGGENCWTVARIDGQIVRWKGAKDNVAYKAVAAFLMPVSWTEDQVQAWTPPAQ